MNKDEADVLREILLDLPIGDLGHHLYLMDNTPENREVLIGAIRFGYNKSNAEREIGFLPDETSDDKLETSNLVLLKYIVHCIERHLRITPAPSDEAPEQEKEE